MSRPHPPKRTGITERTEVVDPQAVASRSRWRTYAFTRLERVSKGQALLAKKAEWLLPPLGLEGTLYPELQRRLNELFETEFQLRPSELRITPPADARRFFAHPSFVAAVALAPGRPHGFFEVELPVAHAAIEGLLGGAGDTVELRPLTEIEEGVLSYLVLETMRVLSPSLAPGQVRLRLQGIARHPDEALEAWKGESQVLVMQYRAVLGKRSGFMRLYLPASLIAQAQPASDSDERRAARVQLAERNRARLSGLEVAARVEIGRAEISAHDLSGLGEGDVVLVDELWARPDLGEGGVAKLKVGAGRAGFLQAELVLEEGRYRATITEFRSGPDLVPAKQPEEGAAVAKEDARPHDDESTSPHELFSKSRGERRVVSQGSNDGAELLTDIPLQISVELGRVALTADELVALKVGQVLDLNRVPGEPVELSVNGKVLARGELVELEGNLGVRVLSLAE